MMRLDTCRTLSFCVKIEVRTGGVRHETEDWFGISGRSNRFRHGCFGPSQHRAGQSTNGTGVGRHSVPPIAASLVIALEACRVSPADRQKNPLGARKVFMPHIGRLWEASG